MKILHVSLGLPPFRTGGLNNYCSDLIKEQIRGKNDVSLIFPGNFSGRKTKIKKYIKKDIKLFEIINPLPVPLIFGINEPYRYLTPTDKKIFTAFFCENSFDIIHVHSIMGIHIEFFETAKKHNIPILFTSHDYYPFCIRCNGINYKGECCENINEEECRVCNSGLGLSRKQEILMQSKLYQYIKECSAVVYLRRIYKKKLLKASKNKECIASNMNYNKKKNKEYGELLQYYKIMMGYITTFHFNSEVAYKYYSKNIEINNFKIIPITNNSISNKPTLHLRKGKNEVFNIAFMGGKALYKGLDKLLEALNLLGDEEFKNWQLNLYGDDYSEYIYDKRIKNKGKYKLEQLDKIYKETDLLVVPSVWRETYGLVVNEALSYGVPVIVSSNVGSKFLLKDIPDSIYDADSIIDLRDKIKLMMNNECYNRVSKWIYDDCKVEKFIDHSEKINELYNELILSKY